MASERFRVRVTKDHLAFAAAHFITYDGGHCERLHGHNYRLAVEVEGPLDANHYVFDFVALKRHAQALADELDHRVLLPTRSALITVEETADSVRARHGDREWVFPRGDCVLLPVENTTAELLARHIGSRLAEVLRGEHQFTPAAVRVQVEEGPGQSATWEAPAEPRPAR